MPEEFHQKNNSQKSSDLSGDLPNAVGKKHGSLLNKLILAICISTIGFVGMNFVACNFMLPGSMNGANLKGQLKNPPPLDCKESERRGYDTLIILLTTVIALRTKVED